MIEKPYQWESIRHQGRPIEVIHERTLFESDYEIVDGEVACQCKNFIANDSSVSTRCTTKSNRQTRIDREKNLYRF